VVYRGAREQIHRDIHALDSTDGGRTFTARRLDTWEIGACPMSSMDIVLTGSSGLFAWERDGQVVLATRPGDGQVSPPAPEAPESRRKHPRVAVAANGTMLLAWAEGTGWKRGGAVGWQAFRNGRALTAPIRREGLPVWGTPAVAHVADRFVILY
jgi:hypothetical protein